MAKRLLVPALFLYALIISSCGTQKKLDACIKETDSLRTENAALKKQNQAFKDEVTRLNTANAQTQKELAESQRKLQAIVRSMTEEAESMRALHAKLDKALADFENHGVTIYEKNGHLYVSMEENLLYKSGSAALDSKGKQALGSLASVLNEY